MKILLLTSKKHKVSKKILYFLKKKKFKITYVDKILTKKKITKISKKNFDLIISFLYGSLVPIQALKRTNIININFHPGPPNYPGYGCYNHAILNEASTYGCTAHLMNSKYDNGKIIDAIYFPISQNIQLDNLIHKTHKKLFLLFKKVIKNLLINNFKVKMSTLKWTRLAYTKKEFEKKRQINLSISYKELKKRIRAFSYKDYPSIYLKEKGFKFEKK